MSSGCHQDVIPPRRLGEIELKARKPDFAIPLTGKM
jgi:hypothetical protein